MRHTERSFRNANLKDYALAHECPLEAGPVEFFCLRTHRAWEIGTERAV